MPRRWFLILLAACLSTGACKSDGKKKVHKAPGPQRHFRIKIPGSGTAERAGDLQSGFVRQKRPKLGELIQVTWEAGGPVTEVELKSSLHAAMSDIGCKTLDSRTVRSDADFRQHVVCRQRSGFSAVTTAHCKKNQYTVTLTASAPELQRVKEMQRSLVDTFHCAPTAPPPLKSRAVSSILGPEWGYSKAKKVDLLAHANGRSIIVASEAGSYGRKVHKHPHGFLRLMSRRMGYRLRPVGKMTRIRTLSGDMSVLHSRTGPSPVVLGALYCEAVGRTYTFFVTKSTGEPEHLSPLLSKFGCPGSGPPVTARKNNCDMPGHDDACIR